MRDTKKQIALIACASQKVPHRAKAGELYTSTLFQLNMQYAHSRGIDNVRILSAKFGLLDPETVIEPYNVTLNTMSTAEIKRWSTRVLTQMNDIYDLQRDHFVFLAGMKYRKFLVPYIASYEVPMEGLPIGKQLQLLKHRIAELCP